MFVQRLQDYENYSPEGEPVLDTFAEVQQRWHIWRRRYDLFLKHGTHRVLSLASDPQPEPEPTEDTFHQFARIDGGLFAWNFSFMDAYGKEIANVNRRFRGFGREVSAQLLGLREQDNLRSTAHLTLQIFTDTGRYVVHFTAEPLLVEDPSGQVVQIPNPNASHRTLTLDERAVSLTSTACQIPSN